MSTRPGNTFFLHVLALTWVGTFGTVLAADNEAGKKENKVAGILIEKENKFITVKADGEDDSVKYLIDDADKKVVEAMKGIFNASRVMLTYKADGDTRRILTIKKQVTQAKGTVTGTVVKVYNEFWIEVKPKVGFSDAYATGVNDWNNKEFKARLKALQPGDSVTIKYSTDFERHRIESLRKN